MTLKSKRYCPGCEKNTEQIHYDDYRPGKPYEYYQCAQCGSCWYMCKVHLRFEADIQLSNQEAGQCACYEKDEEDRLTDIALADANREMFGEDADYFDAAGIDDIGAK